MHKHDILQMILAQKGEYLSGQQISDRIGISRAAVAKYIRQLESDGFVFEARTRQGYRLTGLPDRLSLPVIQNLLTPSAAACPIEVHDEVDSTNLVAKRLAIGGAVHGTCVLAERQSAGRGRFDRSFYSPPGSGVYLSMVLRPELPVQRLMVLTAFTAVAVCDAIEQVASLRPQIKWTNDIVWSRQKLCGISTETSMESETGRVQYAVIGIGINCNQRREDFPAELQNVATSLLAATGKRLDRNALAAAVISRICDMCSRGLESERGIWLSQYKKDCMTVGQEIRVVRGSEQRRGTALDLDDNAALVVRFEDGSVETVNAGEVSVRGMYGYA